MTSELKVDKITPASGTNTQIGEAGDTTNLSAGTVTLPTSIITGASEKTTLVDADKFLIADSADSNAFKHVQKSNMPGGGFEFINTITAGDVSHTNAVLDNVFTSTYDVYKILGFATPTQNSEARIKLRSSGSDVSDGQYNWINMATYIPNGASLVTDVLHGNHASDFWEFGSDDVYGPGTNDSSIYFDFTLYQPYQNILSRCWITGMTCWRGTTQSRVYNEIMSGARENHGNTDGIKFFFAGGNIKYYRISIYGAKHA